MRGNIGKNIRRKERLLAKVLLAIVCHFYCGNTFFMHSHEFGDEIVWHSHPFTSNPHTKSAADAIAHINHAIFTEEVEFVEINPIIITFAPIEYFVDSQIKSATVFCKFLRAPPSYI